ncbi:MAG: aldehyde ferredoxin oxidoreductase family protein [Oscillospiraceae bacterium]|nr:aldehyde ferredoxin oxidoreductase family protein [Oscillospiraceae bacterium]
MHSKYCGYMGRVMLFDLSTGKSEDYPWTDDDREKYIGGKIMAAKILYDHLKGDEQAFSEDNWIVISTGPMTGTGVPSSARFNVSAISPQTGILASSNCGGSFGIYLKKAGYDAIILKGRCDRPSWLEITEDSLTLHSADELWGMKTSQCQEKLRELIPAKKFGALCIGPAGENLVRYAGLVSDERSAGRTGLGAVMGWKNLKAITAEGNKLTPVYDKDRTAEHMKKWVKYLHAHPLAGDIMPKYGTANLVRPMQQHGLLSTRNYAAGQYDDFEKVSGEELAANYNIKNSGCISCPIRCTRKVKTGDREVKGPELETLVLLGGNLLNNDMQKVIDWNYLLDELGMDTISTANTVAWAMEANEKGLWDNGLEFGKTDGLAQLFEDIAHRRGIGAELAEGTKCLSEKYGGRDFAIHSKGLELAAYEPRRAVGQGLGYAVSNRGGCHINGGYAVIVEGLGLNADPQTTKAKADITMLMQNLLEALSAGGQCIFTSYGFFPAFLLNNSDGVLMKSVNAILPHMGWMLRLINKHPTLLVFHLPVIHHTRMYKYALGMNMTFGKWLRIGERGYNLERSINCRFGISAANDKLPKRLTHVPQDAKNPKTIVPLEAMKQTYYKARGWDKNGIPTEKTLKKLKIK